MLSGQTGSDTSTLRPVETWTQGGRVYYKFKITRSGELPRIIHDGADGTWTLSDIQIEQSTYPTAYSYEDVQKDLNNPNNYMWQLTKGKDGAQGAPGEPGKDGKTPYYHLAYANKNADGRYIDFSFTDEERQYKGTYVDYEPKSSTDPTKYKWEKSIWQLDREKASQIDINNVIEILSRTQDKVDSIDTTLNITKDNAIITHSAEYITLVEKLVGDAENVDKQLKLLEKIAEKIDTYFIFDDAFTIGKSNSKNKVRVDNQRVEFLDGETVMAYASGTFFNMQNARIQGAFEFGNHKAEAEGDNTNFRWIGGNNNG